MQLHHRGLIALLFLLLFFPGVSNSESLVEDASASLDNEKGSCPHDSSSVSESDGVCTATQKPKTKTHYIRAAITNSADNRIRQHLDELELLITPEKVEKCIDGFDKLLSKYPNSPRGRYGKARCLDVQSEKESSNKLLEKAIEVYQQVIKLPEVPLSLLELAVSRLVSRLHFRGWSPKATKLLEELVTLYPSNLNLSNTLGVAYLMTNRPEKALQIFQKSLQIDPFDGFAMVHLGFILKTSDKVAEGVDYMLKGIETQAEGTKDGRFYFHLGDGLQRLGRVVEAYKVYDLGAQSGMFLSKYQRSLYNCNGLKSKPFWAIEETTYKETLEKIQNEWQTIRDEGISLLNKEGTFDKEDEKLTQEGDWKQFTLWQRGKMNKASCDRAPKTCAIVKSFRESTSCTRGQIKFSVMHPGTKVWPHCGPTNCRLRAHLGLIVPPGAQIKVAEETRTWKEGEFLILDDSFEHSVWHDGDQFRLILIVDFWHPDVSANDRLTLRPI